MTVDFTYNSINYSYGVQVTGTGVCQFVQTNTTANPPITITAAAQFPGGSSGNQNFHFEGDAGLAVSTHNNKIYLNYRLKQAGSGVNYDIDSLMFAKISIQNAAGTNFNVWEAPTQVSLNGKGLVCQTGTSTVLTVSVKNEVETISVTYTDTSGSPQTVTSNDGGATWN